MQSRHLVTTIAAALPLAILATGALVAESAPRAADLVLRNGIVVTLDSARARATALAARDGRIVAVGTDADVAPFVGPETHVIDLASRLAIPGFVDAHAHFVGIGEAAENLKLADCRSWNEVVARVAEAAARTPKGAWIVGRGWHQEKWNVAPAHAVEGFPVHATLSAATPDHPVLLSHASGHAVFVNARAMALAGIDGATPDPPGGEILHDPDGRPTGLLRENAEELAQVAFRKWRDARSPAERDAAFRHTVELADREVLAKGITTLHDAGETFATIDKIAALADAGAIGTRLYVMVGDTLERLRADLPRARRVGAASNKLTVRAIKAYMDGALGSRGAWLLAPYSDLPGSVGLGLTPLPELEEIARLALANGYQLATHAIGDRANRETLDLYARVLATAPDGKLRRWRIEHAQHLDPADIPRFSALGVVAAMQGIHCTSDAPFVVARLGETRARAGAYAWRRLIDAGAIVANGTDAPVEDVDPIPSFYATVTRRLANGTRFFPEQALTREEALRTYTWNGAYAAFEENDKGSLEVGKLADVTVIDRDILTVPEEEILKTKVIYTIVGGKVLYSAQP